jgi:hypothetical protein
MKNYIRLAVFLLVTAIGINVALPTFSAEPIGNSPVGPPDAVDSKSTGVVTPTPPTKSASQTKKKKKIKRKSNQLVGKSRKA